MKVKLPSEEAGWSLRTQESVRSQQKAESLVMSLDDLLRMSYEHSFALAADDTAGGDTEVPFWSGEWSLPTHRGPSVM